MPILSISLIVLIVVEILLFSLLWFPSFSNQALLISVAHGVITLFISYWISKKWQQPLLSSVQVWLMLFVFIFFLPVIGGLVLYIISHRKILRKKGIEAGIGVEPEAEDENKVIQYVETSTQHYLNEDKKTHDLISTLDDNTYLRLLVASRHLPDKEAYTLLKEALSSPFESARLMAFSLKGTLEERLQDELQDKLERLENTPKHQKGELHLAIAKDYLHRLEIGLLSEDNETLIKQAEYHSLRSIGFNKHSADAFYTLSKLFKHQGKDKQAQQAQIKAVTLGFPLERLYSHA